MVARQIYQTLGYGVSASGFNRAGGILFRRAMDLELSELLGIEGAKLTKISNSERAALRLEGMVDLELRSVVYRRAMKDGTEIFIKPYASEGEKEAISRLHGSDISFVLAHNDFYFAEERPNVPRVEDALLAEESRILRIEDALREGKTNLQEIAPLFARALYELHSREIAYNRAYVNSLYYSRPETLKITNFTAATPAAPAQIREDLMRAFKYLESLGSYDTVIGFHQSRDRSQAARAYFYKAIASFVSSYVLDMNRDNNIKAINEIRDLMKQMAKNSQDGLLSSALTQLNKLMRIPKEPER